MLHDLSWSTHGMIRVAISLVLVSVTSLALYAAYLGINPHASGCPAHSYAPAEAQVTVEGAPYLRAEHLLARPFPHTREYLAEVDKTIPKLIHQSWKEEQLPHKFLQWSNSWRIRHPDWQWVLWTDADNDELVERHWPMLNETYQSLRGNIYRADFVRNLYMYTYGGMYADLDMECLRPMDDLIQRHMNALIETRKHDSSPHHPLYQLALVGSMEAGEYQYLHSIPNAWMASSPGHPFWLLPITSAMHALGADSTGFIADKAALDPSYLESLGWKTDKTKQPEKITGPIALREQVLVYQDWEKTSARTTAAEAKSDAVLPHHPALHFEGEILQDYDRRHGLTVLPHAVIYPFSWDTSINPKDGEIYRKCRLQSKGASDFDALGCQAALEAYEHGARAITYWSHSWSSTNTLSSVVDLLGS